MKGKLSKTGVFVYEDYRDQLIIDKYDEVFQNMRESKIEHLKSENSEDVITWNVFRTLQQVSPQLWLPKLFHNAFNKQFIYNSSNAKVTLWKIIQPPRERMKREGPTEVDIIIESNEFVWFIEAKYKSDISVRTTHDPERNQIIRNIDVGTNYSGKKDFYFSLLLFDEKNSPVGHSLIKEYQEYPHLITEKLTNQNGEQACKGIGLLTWSSIKQMMEQCEKQISATNERFFLKEAVRWLESKEIYNEKRIKLF